MREILRNSLQVTMNWNGLAHDNGLCVRSNCQNRMCCYSCNRNYCHGLYGGFAITKNRHCVGICGFNFVSMSIKGHTWFQCVRLKMRPMGNSVVVSKVVISDESGLVFQENEEKELVQGEKDELDLDSIQKHLPPWGNLMAHQESNLDPEIVVEPSTPLKTIVAVNESRVHFLEETDEEVLSTRILMLSRSNKVRSALELFRSMEFSGLRPNAHACNSLLSCFLRNKLPDNALTVFEFMKTKEIATGHTYSLILKTVAGNKGCDSALKMFGELEQFSHGKKAFDVIVYNTMLSICGRVNNWVETERIWRSMKGSGLCGTQVTYSLLTSIFVRCGKYELALDAYDEMVQNGLEPREDTMQAIIGASTKERKWDLALNVFQNALDLGLKPNLIACNALINSLGKAGEVKLAFKVFEKVKCLGHTPDVYTWNALLGGLYMANQHANALQLFESIKREQSCQLNEHLYHTALMSCQKLKLWDRALQLLWQMEASGLSVSTASYNLVIGACEIARKPTVALQVYERMVHQKRSPDTFTFWLLIRGCMSASLWDEVEKILDAAPNVSLYNAVIHRMCLRGKVEQAKKLYSKMHRSGLKPGG